ncbi:hypothetical protein QPM05_14425, partial [Caldibacillus thermoamylovorans]|nr:hypothetical protein [Caldibacillus thermoamylovorans]
PPPLIVGLSPYTRLKLGYPCRFLMNMNKLGTRMGNLEKNQSELEVKINNLGTELRSNFSYTNSKLDEHRQVFNIVSEKFKKVEMDIDAIMSR